MVWTALLITRSGRQLSTVGTRSPSDCLISLYSNQGCSLYLLLLNGIDESAISVHVGQGYTKHRARGEARALVSLRSRLTAERDCRFTDSVGMKTYRRPRQSDEVKSREDEITPG